MVSMERVQLFRHYIAKDKLVLAKGWIVEWPDQLFHLLISINLIFIKDGLIEEIVTV